MFAGLILCLATTASSGALITPGEAEAWREDLLFVQQEMPRVHPDLFATLPRQEFEASISALIERAPSMNHYQIITELAAIVAAVGDGHTRLTLPVAEGSGFFAGHSPTPPPKSPAMVFHYLPIRLSVFDDGVFVQEIARENAAFVGARVERIGGLPIDEAIDRISPVIHHDNEMQVLSILPSRLVIPELLEALGITADRARTAFELSIGDEPSRRLVLEPVPEGTKVDWVSLDPQSREAPLYLRHPDRHFWFEYLEDRNALFCQYNEVYNEDGESIAAFSTGLTDFMTRHSVGCLLLDLRFNQGGNNALNRSFLHALIRCSAIREPGSFFVLIGRNTFSAAMMFAIDLEKHTNAIFVGEPTGARPNHFGDSRKIQLPNSGLTIRVSTLYWQYSGPKDDRPWLPPHIPVRYTSDDARMGRDPAVERIFEIVSASEGGSPAGTWVGRILDSDIVVNLRDTNGKWEATIDFPNEGATGLPLINVRHQAPSLSFDFPNGDETISFQGTLHGDVITGRALLDGQAYLWVITRSN